MSAAVSTSSAGFQSDMHLLVEQCVAQVREAAGLASAEDAIVLPKAPPLSKKPPPLPTKRPPPLPLDVASSNVFLGLAPTIAWDANITAPAAPAAPAIVAPLAKPKTASRWPLFLCAFVAGVSAGASFIASPAGQRPAVRHVVASVRAEAAHVTASIRSAR